MRTASAPCSNLSTAALLAAVLFATAAAAQSLPKESPFLPPAGPSDQAQSAPSAYELMGATTFGKDTLLGITRQQDRRSVWIPLGKTVNEITAVSYDPKKDEAVIRANGQLLTLRMRKSGVVSGSPAPVFMPANVATASAPNAQPAVEVPMKPLNVQEEKEMEARMLVTDLLEIGQQQRKAYEEAQRQAAARARAGGNASKNPTASKP